uniref:MOB kinase activator 2 n=2 Tax=Coturnix japonica TaxID=93934 RepID=A0A8C2U735_COTJA
MSGALGTICSGLCRTEPVPVLLQSLIAEPWAQLPAGHVCAGGCSVCAYGKPRGKRTTVGGAAPRTRLRARPGAVARLEAERGGPGGAAAPRCPLTGRSGRGERREAAVRRVVPRGAPLRRTMVGDQCSLPAERPVHAQSPKAGLSCKMVLQAVGKVLRKSKGKPNGKKPAPEEKKLYLEPEYTKSRITDFEFKELVMLPREIDLNEWLASNTTTFFHHINLQYSTISEFCTGESCQTMAVCNTQYYWYDERGKKIKCTAPQYVDFVMSSVQKLVTDEDVFPTKYGKEFPNSFESLVKKICKYLFHVLAHIYSSHFKETLALELHGHLNTLYTHFILFIREFNLVDLKETTIMDDLTEVLCSSSGSSSNGSGNGSSNSAAAQNHVKER